VVGGGAGGFLFGAKISFKKKCINEIIQEGWDRKKAGRKRVPGGSTVPCGD